MTAEPDLLFQDEVREIVRRAYAALPTGAGAAVAARFYDASQLSLVPPDAVSWALGVGDPVGLSDITTGETVLDVGCGGGIDSVLAGLRVGNGGQVIGLDLLPEMCDRARTATEAAGTAAWSRFSTGAMEDLPLDDDSVDVVLTNGVLNLSPRRSRALLEFVRVLRPGGRLWACDLTVERDLPPEVLGSEAAWAGCIAGAVSPRRLREKLEQVGFADVAVEPSHEFGLDDIALYPLFTAEALDALRRELPNDQQHRVATAHVVHARLPEDASHATAYGDRERQQVTPSGVQRIDDVPTVPVEAPGVTVRKLGGIADADLKVLDVAPSSSTPHHVHLRAHEGVVIAGHGHLRLDTGPQPLRPGAVFRVNPRDRHAIVNDGDDPLRVVCMDCLSG